MPTGMTTIDFNSVRLLFLTKWSPSRNLSRVAWHQAKDEPCCLEIIILMNLWGITVKCTVYGICRFSVFVWGPYISDWDSDTNCFTIIQLYNIFLWRFLNLTNKNYEVIRVWININTIHVMFYSLYYAVYNMNNRISTSKYWNIFSFL